eukprot:4734187-Pyramimonas_sp.AAC.1
MAIGAHVSDVRAYTALNEYPNPPTLLACVRGLSVRIIVSVSRRLRRLLDLHRPQGKAWHCRKPNRKKAPSL